MTRSERIRKLANAIKDYRGSYHPNTGAWIRPPDRKAISRVSHWLIELGVQDLAGAVNTIDNFVNYDDFIKWLKGLETTHSK